MTKNETMLNWVGEMRELVQPDQVVWIDGSQEQLEALRAKACNDGDLIKLNQNIFLIITFFLLYKSKEKAR